MLWPPKECPEEDHFDQAFSRVWLIPYKSSDYIRPNAECPSSFQPAESLRLSFAARSRSALQVDPKHAAFDYLEINMPPAYICMIKNYVGPQVATNNCKRLI